MLSSHTLAVNPPNSRELPLKEKVDARVEVVRTLDSGRRFVEVSLGWLAEIPAQDGCGGTGRQGVE
jgi:hypothetical protein